MKNLKEELENLKYNACARAKAIRHANGLDRERYYCEFCSMATWEGYIAKCSLDNCIKYISTCNDRKCTNCGEQVEIFHNGKYYCAYCGHEYE